MARRDDDRQPDRPVERPFERRGIDIIETERPPAVKKLPQFPPPPVRKE